MARHTSYWLNYTCQRCGKQDRTASSGSKHGLQSLIPTCHICNRKLCTGCHHLHTCPEHWGGLKPETKAKLEKFEKQRKKSNKVWTGICIVNVIFGFGEFFLTLDDRNHRFLYIPVIAYVILGCLVMSYHLFFRMDKRDSAIFDKIIDMDPNAKNLTAVSPSISLPGSPSISPNMTVRELLESNEITGITIGTAMKPQPADQTMKPPISPNTTMANPPPNTGQRFCTNCGSVVAEGLKFCGKCGHPQ